MFNSDQASDVEGDAAHPPIQVVILAAGMGTRLGRSTPKPLTELRDGRTILQQQLDNLRSVLGADVHVTVVVGYRAELMRTAAPDVAFVANPHYATTNTSKSLLQALTVSPRGGVMWLNGDVVFDSAILDAALPEMRADRSFVCVNRARVADEEVKYTVDADGFIRELSKIVTGGLGEAIGINYISAAAKPTLIAHLKSCRDTDYFERGIETAIADDHLQVRPVDISSYAAVEVDFEDDLLRANLSVLGLENSGSDAMVGPV